MSHEVEKIKGEIAHVSAKHVKPWHHLTVEIDDPSNLWKAMAKGNLVGWNVEKMPIEAIDIVDGTRIPVKGENVLIRRLDNKILTRGKTVSDSYEVIQLEDIFEALEPYFDQKIVQVECAGSLAEGRRPFILLRFTGTDISKQYVGKDEVVPYLLVNTSFDGESALYCDLTGVQVVCMNTLRMAEEKKIHPIYIPHTKDATARMTYAMEALTKLREEWEANVELFNVMSEIKMDQRDFDKITKRLLDIPQDKSYELLPKQTVRKINRLEYLFRHGPGRDGDDLFDWYSAVTHYTTHDIKLKTKTDRFESSVFGTGMRLEARARRIAREFMGEVTANAN